MADLLDDANVKPDALLGGRVLMYQSARGHRAGTDAILLAAGVPAGMAGLAIDAGAGVGAAGIAAASQAPELRLALLEREPDLAALARANVAANRLEDRAFVAEADLLDAASWGARLTPQSAALVLTNPPFLSPDEVRVSPDPARASAHVIGAGGLDAWVSACLALLQPGGTFLMIHRADALAAILDAVGRSLGALVILPIYPNAERGATRILVRGLKGRRTPLRLAPPLILHDSSGAFTPQAEALHRGEARIDWDA